MASFKDTFEANAFEAMTFACGAWRGSSTTSAVVPDTEGIEYHLSEGRMHYKTAERMHYRAFGPLHYKAIEDDG